MKTEPPSIEPKAPTFLSNAKWAFLHIRRGGACGWFWGLLTLAILGWGLYEWQQRYFPKKEVIAKTNPGVAAPFVAPEPKRLDPVKAREFAIQELTTARARLREVHFAISKLPANVAGFEQLLVAVAELEAAEKHFRDTYPPSSFPALSISARGDVEGPRKKLSQAYVVNAPEFAACEEACLRLRNLISRSSSNPAYLGAEHATLAMLHDDLDYALAACSALKSVQPLPPKPTSSWLIVREDIPLSWIYPYKVSLLPDRLIVVESRVDSLLKALEASQ